MLNITTPFKMKYKNAVLTAIALLLLSPVAALADSVNLSNGQSATFNYVAVGFPNSTAQATFTYNSVAGTLTLILKNTATTNMKLTEVGFNANMTVNGTPTITYAAGTTANFVNGTQTLAGFSLGANSSGGNAADVLNDGEQLTAVFTLTGPFPTILTISGSQVHLQALPNGSSQKPDGTLVIVGQTSTVPEPASMLLLGSGLVGAAASIRRKRAKK
jgi:hypothetical protein